jgi:hypothetical protein
MKYLLYCVFDNSVCSVFNTTDEPGCNEPNSLIGVEGGAILSVSTKDLCAAVSKIFLPSGDKSPSILNPDITVLLDYGKVIESIHRERTVIPMRYGCTFDKESQVIRFLEEGCRNFKAHLEELDGCVEMGIRVLNNGCEPGGVESGFVNHRTVNAGTFPSGTGRDYLNARKAHYAEEEFISKKTSSLIEKYEAAFDGLFVKVKAELPSINIYRPAIRDLSLTLYFLVPRGSVQSFRAVFRQLSMNESAKLLMSGPWPPYNFVTNAAGIENFIAGYQRKK